MKSLQTSQALFIVSDPFGVMVAERYGATPDALIGREDFAQGIDRPNTPVVSIGVRRDEELRETLDHCGSQWGLPTAGLELLPTRIVCGPAVVPGRTACYRCYRARVAQHAIATSEFGEEVSTAGLPPGFAAFHVALAAGILSLTLQELGSDPLGLGGTVRTVSLITGGITSAVTVAVHRCNRCGPRFRGDRGFDRFVGQIERIP